MGIKLKDFSPFSEYLNPTGEYISDSGRKDYLGALTGMGAFINPIRRDRENRKEVERLQKEKQDYQKRLDAVNKIGGMAKGGVTRKRNIDGAALKGKTKGSRL